MSAGRVFVVGTIACVLGILLNADAIEHTAETKPYGWERSFGVAAIAPFVEISDAVGLNRPREWADEALGRERSEPVDLATLVTASPTTTAPPPTETTVPAVAIPTTTTAPVRTPTAAEPLRMWVGGDSMVGAFGNSLVVLANSTGVISAELDYQVSSGLTRPDYFDWPGHIVAVVTQRQPEVMVIMFGANDAQAMEVDGAVHQVLSPEWAAEYGRRADLMMTYLEQQGVQTYWIGQPTMRDGGFDQQMQQVNQIVSTAAEGHEDVQFIDTRPLSADAAGGYTEYLPDDSGAPQLARAGDGIHLSEFGGNRLAGPVLRQILADAGL